LTRGGLGRIQFDNAEGYVVPYGGVRRCFEGGGGEEPQRSRCGRLLPAIAV